VWIRKASPTIATAASLTPGGAVIDRAHLSNGFEPKGIISFNLFGPNDPTCSLPPVRSERVRVDGNGTYRTRAFRPPAPGIYRFEAAYHANQNNRAARSPCNAPGEAVSVP
jgi:hypothetical protein